MSAQPIRIGVIGAGRIADVVHVPSPALPPLADGIDQTADGLPR